MRSSSFGQTALILAIVCCSLPPSLAAQHTDRCFFLCRPEVKIEPTFTVENLFSRHRVAELDGDEQVGVTQAEREVVFEATLAVEIPTEIPRVGFTFETIFIPFASGSENPFTGMTARQIGRDSIRDNSPEVEIELNLEWLRSDGSSPRQRAEFRRQLPEFASVMGWIGRSASVYRLLVRQRNPQRIEDFCLAGVGNRQPCDAGLLIHSIFQ